MIIPQITLTNDLIQILLSMLLDINEINQSIILNSLKSISLLGPIIITLSDDLFTIYNNETITNLLIFLCKTLSNVYLDNFSIDNDEIVTKCLDSHLLQGYYTINNQNNQIDLINHVINTFPRNRIGVSTTIHLINDNYNHLFNDFITTYQYTADNFIIKYVIDGSLTKKIESITGIVTNASIVLKSLNLTSKQIFLHFPIIFTQDELVQLIDINTNIHIVCHPKLELTESIISCESLSQFIHSLALDYIESFISILRTDRLDGLYSTVVCDELGVCLGLVYSNKESIQLALLDRKGIYWSRSRNSLWRKGESSGMIQDLLSVRCDCDRDALKFTVIQKGDPPAFCHLMTRSCWGESTGFQHLQATLIDRKKSAPVGSYTKRLFNDPALLKMKLLEEVQELVEAVEPDHIAAEAADVMYFLMTRCVAAGVELSDIQRHLDKRALKVTRRPGNAKEWRNQQAQEILLSKDNTNT